MLNGAREALFAMSLRIVFDHMLARKPICRVALFEGQDWSNLHQLSR